jgi:hypothetical protein
MKQLLAAALLFAITLSSPLPKPWFLAGSRPRDYFAGVDGSPGARGLFLASRSARAQGFGTIMQTLSASKHRGTRLRLKAAVCSERVDGWAGVWMRVDGKSRRVLSFDNMQDRPINGTRDWYDVEIVLNVPPESEAISFGILLHGTGTVWLDNVRFEDAAGELVTGR